MTLLFEPLRLRDLTLRNRIVLAPMLTYSATHGYAGDWHVAHLAKFAAGGAGLVFMESTKVEARGCTTIRDCGVWKDEFIPGLRRVVEAVHAHGVPIGLQLGHCGRRAGQALPWEGRGQLPALPGVDHGEAWQTIGPSPIAATEGIDPPHELTIDEIAEVVRHWGDAAARADAAGFDALEIHGAHGYLIHQFLSPLANQRNDRYGGSAEARRTFAVEVATEVRRRWPADKPLFFRVSAVDEAGLTLEDTVALARVLGEVGVDVVDCSSGGISGGSVIEQARPTWGYQVPYAARVRSEAGVATMAVGLIAHADQAEAILRRGDADLVALGREMLLNPHWPLDAATKLGVADPFGTLPVPYGYWLEKRARTLPGLPSTWTNGIDAGAAD